MEPRGSIHQMPSLCSLKPAPGLLTLASSADCGLALPRPPSNPTSSWPVPAPALSPGHTGVQALPQMHQARSCLSASAVVPLLECSLPVSARLTPPRQAGLCSGVPSPDHPISCCVFPLLFYHVTSSQSVSGPRSIFMLHPVLCLPSVLLCAIHKSGDLVCSFFPCVQSALSSAGLRYVLHECSRE